MVVSLVVILRQLHLMQAAFDICIMTDTLMNPPLRNQVCVTVIIIDLPITIVRVAKYRPIRNIIKLSRCVCAKVGKNFWIIKSLFF